MCFLKQSIYYKMGILVWLLAASTNNKQGKQSDRLCQPYLNAVVVVR